MVHSAQYTQIIKNYGHKIPKPNACDIITLCTKQKHKYMYSVRYGKIEIRNRND